MQPNAVYVFRPFRLDPRTASLTRDGRRLDLTPKAFAVLHNLVRHAERVVSKDELLDDVWAGVHVGDAVLKVAIREIRRALADEAREPRFVETLHRLGYRFVAPVSVEVASPIVPAAPPAKTLDAPFVGRERALDALRAAMTSVASGRRRVVFVSGEAGLGKTTVVERFLEEVTGQRRAWVATGHCLELEGAAEAYRPVLDAVARLARTMGAPRVVEVLRRFAPTWLAQLPSLQEPEDHATLQRSVLGATPERMLREIADALDALASDVPLVLFLDDLHWGDDATIDFVSLVARRPESSRLLLVTAFRPVDAILGRRALASLKQQLVARGLADEVALDFLSEPDIQAYLDARFPGHRLPADLAAHLAARTDGNALFLAAVVDHLLERGVVARVDGTWAASADLPALESVVPESLRTLIVEQLERLPEDEQRALESASATGVEFPAAAVAAGLDRPEAESESILERLASRGQFLRPTGVGQLPDGAWSPRFAFAHALYRHAVYGRIPHGRRMRLHLRIAERGEQVYGPRVGEIAAELAGHFEAAHAYERAVHYLRVAAATDARRFANREAAQCLERGLDLIGHLPVELRAEPRVEMLEDYGRVCRSMGDMQRSSESFLDAARAAEAAGQATRQVDALLLAASALSWFDRERCLAVAREAERLATGLSPELRLYARGYSAYWYLLWEGWNDRDADDCETALAVARESGDTVRLFSLLGRCAYARLARSDYARAVDAARHGAELALVVNDAFGRLVCTFFQAWAAILAGWHDEAFRTLDDSIALAETNGHRLWSMLFRALRAWLLRETGALDEAYALVVPASDGAHAADFGFGIVLGDTVRGIIELDRGDIGAARSGLAQLSARLDRERLLMDWIWRMPLECALGEALRLEGDRAGAAAAADRALAIARQCGERTWLARAEQLQARVGESARQVG